MTRTRARVPSRRSCRLSQKLDCVSAVDDRRIDATLFAKRLRNDFEASFRAPDSRELIKSARPLRATTTINTSIIGNNALNEVVLPRRGLTRLCDCRRVSPNRVPFPFRPFPQGRRKTGGKGYLRVDSP